MIKFDDYKNCLLYGEEVLKSQQRYCNAYVQFNRIQ